MLDFLPSGKHRYIMLALLCAGIVLITVGGISSSCEKKTEKTDAEEYYSRYEKECEERIEELCMSLSGVERVSVLVTLERTSEKIYAQNTQTRSDSNSVQTNGEYPSSALLLGEEYPKVRGVAISVTDGDNPPVKKKITELVSASLGISSGKIAVAKAK